MNSGVLLNITDSGIRFGGRTCLSLVHSPRNSIVDLDSITMNQISSKQLKTIEYSSDGKTVEEVNPLPFVSKPFRVAVFLSVNYQFDLSQITFEPNFRFNYSIFAQESFGYGNYSVTAYQSGTGVKVPLHK